MGELSFGRLAKKVAVATVLMLGATVTAFAANTGEKLLLAQATNERNVDAAVPVPDAANMPPLTAKDVRTPLASEPSGAPVDATTEKHETAAPRAQPEPDTANASASNTDKTDKSDTASAPPAPADETKPPESAERDAAPAAPEQTAKEPAPAKDDTAEKAAPAAPATAEQERPAPPAKDETAEKTAPAPPAKDETAEKPATAAPATAEQERPTPPAKQEPTAVAKPAEPPAGPSQEQLDAAAKAIPLPDVADVPPPTLKDVAGPAAGVNEADKAVADKLKELIDTKLARYIDRVPERKAVEAFYKERSYAPLWVLFGAQGPRAKSAIARLKAAAEDGLDPADYAVPDFASATPDALAEAELKLTDSVLTYARNAQVGRIHFSRVSADVQYDLAVPEPKDILANVAKAENVGAALEAYNPQQPGYLALKKKLAELRKGTKAEEEIVVVPPGRLLRPGMKDPRVTLLRQRLNVPGDKNDDTYDQDVVAAVKEFQKGAGMHPDGLLGSNTLKKLNHRDKPRNEVDTVIVNMERWRWLPRDLGKTYVMVNIPNFTLRVVHDSALVWETKIVVGKPGMPTPLISAQMKYITVNPTWNVPPSIIANEYLPALRADPQAMDRIGLRVDYNPDGTVHIYQPPGDRNALGRIRFNFPNKFLVYQHDTPDKHLFKQTRRAFSHGCMRVEDPIKYAEVLLGLVLPQEHYTQASLRGMFGSAERDIKFPRFVPVHITYQTAFVDEAGQLEFRDDVYGRDARMLAILHSKEIKIADIAVPRSPKNSHISRDALRLNKPQPAVGFSFFERLFFR